MRTSLPFYCPLTGDRIIVALHEKQGEDPVIIVEEYGADGEMKYAQLCDSYEKMIQAIQKISNRL
jgi:hypothetical protein